MHSRPARSALLPLALFASIFAPAIVTGGLACGGPDSPAASPANGRAGQDGGAESTPSWGASYVATGGVNAPQARSGPGTAEEAEAYVKKLDHDLRKLWVARDRASWVNLNFITDDTDALAAAGEAATATYVTRATQTATRFDGLKLPFDVARQLHLLKISQLMPAPADAARAGELADLETAMQSHYGKAKACLSRQKGKCLTIDDVEKVMRTSRNYDELLDVWTAWNDSARPLREKFPRYVELGNEGAKAMGYSDVGALWRDGYDMSPADLEADIDRLWNEVRPLYEQLHCYVRSRLRAKYGKDKVPEKGPIPAHLLGNVWAQEWQGIYNLVEPYAGQTSLDVTKAIQKKKLDAIALVKIGERFFTSLGMDPLPKTFWERSLFTRPRNREVVCHASAWDVNWNNNLRIKMCIEPTEEALLTIHHELGHNYYVHQYTKLPVLFQQGANDGFHEGIGDTLALSVTPAYLKSIGLLDALPANNEKAVLNEQMKLALGKVAFLPFGLLIDKWRWDVFSGKITKEHYNEGWYALRRKYQGIAPSVARTETDLDAAAKYHVPSSTPYLRYFLAAIYQFQFHRALCKAAGFKGPLRECSIYGNLAAGEKLKAMLSMGASRPWPEAMAALGGETKADASALLEYFEPLSKWLKEQNKGATCGW